MEISVPRSTRRLALSACALAVLTVTPGAAAKPAAVELRVQAEQQTFAPGQRYLTDTRSIVTDTRRPACGGSGEAVTVQGPTALSLLIDAAGVRSSLRPLGISDKFDFGLLVCAIGDAVSSDEAFWLYKVNHVSPEVGADQRKVKAGDEVLWYFSNTRAQRNTGDELAVEAPSRVKPRATFQVKVTAYDFAGKRAPAQGAQVVYGHQRVTTDARGFAKVTAGSGPLLGLRAVRGSDIASKTAKVCVTRTAAACALLPRSTLNGTGGRDRLAGSNGAERIRAYAGRDRIDVRGGGRDVVRCGTGVDRVLKDRRDSAGTGCEFVNGRRTRASRSPRGLTG